MVEKKIIGCLSWSPSPPHSLAPLHLPLPSTAGCASTWQKPVLDLKTEGNFSVFVTSSAFTRPLVLPPQPAPQADYVVVSALLGDARDFSGLRAGNIS